MTESARWQVALRGYTHPKIIAVLLLGFSSGLPRLLVGGTLAAWLKDSGIDKSDIALFAYVAMPYTLNFCWAPFIDHLRLPFLTKRFGQRRGWMLTTQLGCIAGMLLLSLTDPTEGNGWITAMAAIVLAWFSASQDVVVDAFRTEYLEKDQYSEGAAVAVNGYRIGMLFSGALALMLADEQGSFIWEWNWVYCLMAYGMVIGLLTTLWVKEPPSVEKSSIPRDAGIATWLRQAVGEPFREFISRFSGWWIILLFILLYRLPDGFIGFMVTPFLQEIGFTKTEIAAITKFYGLLATLLGAFLGGALVSRYGLRTCLWIFGIAQILTNVCYLLQSQFGAQENWLMLTITMDNLAGGMITVGAVTYIMRLCNKTYTATQYALMSSLASFTSINAAPLARFVLENYDWYGFFITSALLGIPAMVLIFWLPKETLSRSS